MRNSYFACICFFVLMQSCDKNRVFHSYKNISNTKWHKDSLVIFNFNAPDTLHVYQSFITLRNDNTYKFSNLYLIVELNFPHGKIRKDTLQYKMTNPNGTFLGTGFGNIKENKLWYKENLHFTELGNYQIKIEQAMRENGNPDGITYLEGILDVGFRIEKSKE